jgi:hypothetical protein
VGIVSSEIFQKWSAIQIFLLASSRNIGVHNSIPEYVSTADIYTTPHFHNRGSAIPFHFIWKEIFEECFYHQNLQVLKEMEHWKKERKSIEKKEKGKWKASRVSANKKGKSIFWEEKNISTSILFYVSPFSPPPSYHFQNPFQNHLIKF